MLQVIIYLNQTDLEYWSGFQTERDITFLLHVYSVVLAEMISVECCSLQKKKKSGFYMYAACIPVSIVLLKKMHNKFLFGQFF